MAEQIVSQVVSSSALPAFSAQFAQQPDDDGKGVDEARRATAEDRTEDQ